MEHTDTAQIAALVGALGAVLVLIPRGRFFVIVGLALLGAATGALAVSLVGTDDLELLVEEPKALAALVMGAAIVCLGALPLVRYPAATPVVLLIAAPFRVSVELGEEEAFLLLPLYVVLASTVLALAVRMLRGEHPAAVRLALALPIAAFVTFAAISFLWTWDERAGGIALAFFVFPFVAGLGVVARAPLAPWLPQALVVTLVGLGSLFAAIGIWQAQTRTLFFSPSLEVANAYTTFFRVTSLFKDPSLYGRYLVIPIVVLLVVLLARRTRAVVWIALAGVIAFLFLGLFFSYSQSSFVALFVTTSALALVVGDRRFRIALVACTVAAILAAGAVAATAIESRSARDVTSGRSRLVDITYEAFKLRPAAGVGIGGQPAASAEAIGRRSARRNASHTTPLTVLAELGVVGFGLYGWLLAAIAVALLRIARVERAFALGLAAVLTVLFVHSLLYAGFFEDPLTWGAIGLVAALLARVAVPGSAPASAPSPPPPAPEVLAH
ncbi:MAG TPA: O-antigen ligase family protein [Gaiellaceae bacterium]|nr:O-antigen ligase family protein [Gaiellaceae bacterium]